MRSIHHRHYEERWKWSGCFAFRFQENCISDFLNLFGFPFVALICLILKSNHLFRVKFLNSPKFKSC